MKKVILGVIAGLFCLSTIIFVTAKNNLLPTIFMHTLNPKTDSRFSSKTLGNFFKQSIKTPSSISLIAVGDIMLAREVAIRSTDPSWAFANVSSFLHNADITFANLESPSNESCVPASTGMVFCAPTTQYEALISNGIDIVSVANNHAGDQGQKGLEFTKKFLKESGIKTVGYGEPHYITVLETTFGFLAYNSVPPKTTGIAWAETEKIKLDVLEVKKTSDVAIVSFHWGNEYTTTITDSQKEFAYAAIDSGADVVLGHHPHWIQKIEYYKEKPIFYSLGNFIFDQMWSQKTREGLAVKLTFDNKSLSQVELFPILIENYGQPRLMEGKTKEELVTAIHELSKSR